MATGYTLEKFDATQIPMFAQFFSDRNGLELQTQLEWRFLRNPAGPSYASVFRVDGEVLGMNAFLRVPLQNSEVTAFQSMDTFVSERARGKGVFRGLIENFYEYAPPGVLFGFPNESSSPGFFGKLGWNSFGPVPLFVRPYPPTLRSPSKQAIEERFRVLPVDRFEDELLRSVTPTPESPALSNSYTAHNLNWRFLDPAVSHLYSVYRTEGNGFLVLGNPQDKHGSRVAYIMDCFGPTREVGRLLKFANALLRHNGTRSVLAWASPGSSLRSQLLRRGFVPLPNRIRPVKINFGGRYFGTGSPNRPMRAEDWSVTYLNSDTV